MEVPNSNSGTAKLEDLPIELKLHLFSFLFPPIKHLNSCVLVCKEWYALINNETFWRSVCMRWISETSGLEGINLDHIHKELHKRHPQKGWKWIAACFSCNITTGATALGWTKGSSMMAENEITLSTGTAKRTISIIYKLELGQFELGILHGFGLRVWLNKKYKGHFYVGMFVRGTFEGEGVYVWPNNRTLEGNFENNNIQGRGAAHWPTTGFHYIGEFKDDWPLDREKSMHPLLTQAIQNNKCTATITRDGQDYGQWCFVCLECGTATYWCSMCIHTCHALIHPSSSTVETWTYGTDHCTCYASQHCLCR